MATASPVIAITTRLEARDTMPDEASLQSQTHHVTVGVVGSHGKDYGLYVITYARGLPTISAPSSDVAQA